MALPLISPAKTLLLASALTLLLQAQREASAGPRCENLGGGHLSAVVICPPGLGEAQLRAAGEAACAGLATCHAWIWDDPDAAPNEPISRSSPMTGAQFDSAVALWVSYTQTLYVCGGPYC